DCFYPRGRPTLRRRADGNRCETFRRRFAKLCRRGDRCHPLLQTCARSRNRWRPPFALRLFCEASAGANDRRRSASLRRAIHSWRARKLTLEQRFAQDGLRTTGALDVRRREYAESGPAVSSVLITVLR